MTTWSQVLKKEFQWRNLSLQHNQPQEFAQSQWQCWLFCIVYRWSLVIYLLVALILSVVQVFDLNLAPAKLFIYFTDWTFLCLIAQALLAAILVTKYRLTCDDTSDAGMSALHKLYWALNNVANVLSPTVSLGYWVAVYNPHLVELDFVTLTMHAGNSAIVLLDFFICSHPVRLVHVYQPMIVSAVYLGFTGVYYLAGGTNYYNVPRIYPFLDWRNPRTAILLVPIVGTSLVLIHISLWLLYLLRSKLVETLTRGSGEGQTLLVSVRGEGGSSGERGSNWSSFACGFSTC